MNKASPARLARAGSVCGFRRWPARRIASDNTQTAPSHHAPMLVHKLDWGTRKDRLPETIEETFTDCRMPRQHHRHLKRTNMLERLNEDIKQRTYVAEFPNAESCLRPMRHSPSKPSNWVTGALPSVSRERSCTNGPQHFDGRHPRSSPRQVWIDRMLLKEGIESHLVDPASIATSRRWWQAKTDSVDRVDRTPLASRRPNRGREIDHQAGHPISSTGGSSGCAPLSILSIGRGRNCRRTVPLPPPPFRCPAKGRRTRFGGRRKVLKTSFAALGR
jgi:Transposase, Mutator family